MKEIKYGKTTVLATAVLLRTVRENLSQLEEMNWEKGKPENHNLLTSHEDFAKLTELSDNLLGLLDIESNFVDEIMHRPGSEISISIYDHSGDDTGIEPKLFPKGIYQGIELTTDWLQWYKDSKESKEEQE